MTLPAHSRFDAGALRSFAEQMFLRAGMPADKARDVADILVEGDLLGHDTHGLQLLPVYLEEIAQGRMTLDGGPEVLNDHGVVLAWEGRRLPGPWLMLRAIEEASARARRLGTGIVSVRHSHHIAALATYARRVAEDGLVLVLMSSAPGTSSVAPFGGTRGVFSPSPIGVGIPTGGEPVMVDVSTSITTMGLTGRLAREGARLPGAWVIDEQGVPTDDPAVVTPPRKGALLPLGGTDVGHKGYGLGLMVEALTAGLAGQGRSDPGPRWGATIYLQVIDPQAFSGTAAFEQQMDWIARQCESNPPADPARPVRLPGRRGLALRREQLGHGVSLPASVVKSVGEWAAKLGVPMPEPLSGGS
ncbi:Ldh family oxidoreductase [Ramlibacter tataouinensis]|uniref:Ldh family oxidoreductase n=1 Tax=Ramlibacter tataouinensis TaxID=94132 RepID=UPI0002D2EBF4|nr:Ldh family oxidoreductase [Ramlibacter tataouinensis]